MNQTRDKQIKDLQQVVENKKAEIAKKDKTYMWKTNCVFSFSQDTHGGTNLATVTSQGVLVEMTTFLLQKGSYFDEAVKFLGLDLKTHKWNSFPVKDWLEDIKARSTKLQLKEEKTKLSKLEKQLNGLLSDDAKADEELASIADLLK